MSKREKEDITIQTFSGPADGYLESLKKDDEPEPCKKCGGQQFRIKAITSFSSPTMRVVECTCMNCGHTEREEM